MSAGVDGDEPAPTQSPPPWRCALRRAAQIVLVAVALGYVARTLVVNWDELTGRDVPFDGLYVALAVPFGLAYVVLRGWLWHRIIARLGAEVPARIDVAIWLVAMLGKYVPGKVFMVLGRVFFYRKAGLASSRVALGFAYEMLSLFMVAMFFAGVGVTWPEAVGGRLINGLSLVGLVVLVLVSHPSLLRAVVRRARPLRALEEALPAVRPHDPVVWGLGMLLCYGVLGVGFFLLARALAPVSPTSAFELTAAFATAGVAGIVMVLAPSGLGVREGVLTLLLSPLLTPGVAAALALLSRLWLTAAELVGASVAAGVVRRFRLPPSEDSTI